MSTVGADPKHEKVMDEINQVTLEVAKTESRLVDMGKGPQQCPKRTFRVSRDSAPGPARPTGAPGVPCLPVDCASARTEVESPLPQTIRTKIAKNVNVQHVQLRKHRCTHMFHQGAAKCTAVLSRSSECTEHPANGKYMYLCERTALYMFSSD